MKRKNSDNYKVRVKDKYGCVLFDEYAENFEDVRKVFKKAAEKMG